MKIISKFFILFLMVSVTLSSCDNDDDPQPAEFALESLMSGTIDLYGSEVASNVPVEQEITATFSADVDESTISAITLTNGVIAVDITPTVNGKVVTFLPEGGLATGSSYKIDIATTLKSIEGVALKSTVSSTFLTEGIGLGTPPQSANQVLYIQFDGNVDDITGLHTADKATNTYTTDRFGRENRAGYFAGASSAGTGQIVNFPSGADLISASMTVSLWMKVDTTEYTDGASVASRGVFGLAAMNGYMCEFGFKNTEIRMGFHTDHINDGTQTIYATNWGNYWDNVDGNSFHNTWKHVVFVFDAATRTKSIYIDGVSIVDVLFELSDDGKWDLKGMALKELDGVIDAMSIGAKAGVGNTKPDWAIYDTAEDTFLGAMDDFRIFNNALQAAEVATLYNAEKAE